MCASCEFIVLNAVLVTSALTAAGQPTRFRQEGVFGTYVREQDRQGAGEFRAVDDFPFVFTSLVSHRCVDDRGGEGRQSPCSRASKHCRPTVDIAAEMLRICLSGKNQRAEGNREL
jgi:hypothetical protein